MLKTRCVSVESLKKKKCKKTAKKIHFQITVFNNELINEVYN